MIGARAYGHAAQKTPAPQPLVCRDLISVRDFSPEEIKWLFQLTRTIKKKPADFRDALAGKQLVLFFEKASLRTRLTFEAGMASMGGTSGIEPKGPRTRRLVHTRSAASVFVMIAVGKTFDNERAKLCCTCTP